MLSPLLDLSSLTNIRFAFISERTPDRHSLYDWFPFRHGRQFLYQAIISFDMAVEVIKAHDPDVFLIFEHKAHYALLLYLALLWKRKPVLFFVHGLQQTCWRGAFYMYGLNLLKFLVRYHSFYPIHLELGDQSLNSRIRFKSNSSLLIPFPHPLAAQAPKWTPGRWQAKKFRIGVVGMLRKDKPTRKLMEALIQLHNYYPDSLDLVIGTPFWQKEARIDNIGVEVVDTSSESSYFAILESLHISINDFNRSDYFFRPSGVINDAGMSGCYVLCPKYPVFEAHISTPVTIGKTYQSYEELPELIFSAIDELRINVPDFTRWRSHRMVDSIAPIFKSFLDDKIVTRVQ